MAQESGASTQERFATGLRFACARCGACCTGAPGAVWVSDDEIAALAVALGLTAEQFERCYVRRDGPRRRLYEWPSGDCVLYQPQSRGCLAYHARPRQCRSWPFWESNLTDERAWQAASEQCPGCALSCPSDGERGGSSSRPIPRPRG
jgi:Fe-S-cluster containining protein